MMELASDASATTGTDHQERTADAWDLSFPGSRLRVRPVTGGLRMTWSCDTAAGHVAIEHIRVPDQEAAIVLASDRLIRVSMTESDRIYRHALPAFKAYRIGRPGFRQKSPALRQIAEMRLNALFSMVEGIARAWRQLEQIALDRHIAMPPTCLPDWLSHGLIQIESRYSGETIRIEDIDIDDDGRSLNVRMGRPPASPPSPH
jgi:hypothetical protein